MELNPSLILSPTSTANGQPDLHFKYISATKAFVLLQLVFSPQRGSLAALQLDKLVQLFWCRAYHVPCPPSINVSGLLLFQTLWAGAVSLTDSLSACSRQSVDTPSYSFSQVSSSDAEPFKKEKAWSNHILFRNCSCRTHQITDVSNVQMQLLKW